MGKACCGPGPDVERLQAEQRRALKIVLAINASTFAMMLVASLASGSVSLLSGGLDNLGDALTYGASIAVVGRPAPWKARVSLLKAALILAAAMGVAVQLAIRIGEPSAPALDTMSVAAVLNLAANVYCLRLLTPFRHGDINMASSWECSRNDVMEGVAVLLTAGAVWLTGSGWADIVVAAALPPATATRSRRGSSRSRRRSRRPPPITTARSCRSAWRSSPAAWR
ncbi:MAG: cation transporter [Pseudomonadota bacterium]|jgi:Co/Zn/Cd efflux system component|uniref:cation transporter n=1 Tax=Tepidiphilus succinatimandens TaxID=224436 RepID=UPI001980CE26|nr:MULTISPECIES: cation transporter [Pseudomonadota]